MIKRFLSIIHNLLIKMFLVTGGKGGSGSLDSTEVYDPSVGSWVMTEAKLPRPRNGLRALNIDDRVLIFGRFLSVLTHINPHK